MNANAIFVLAFLFFIMETVEYFKIGYVAKSHGLKGEVTIVLGPECPDLEGLKSLFVESKNQLVPYFIELISLKGNKAFLKLEDVNTPELSYALKGCGLFLPKSDRPKLLRGEFYSDEVVGFEVSDREKGILGPISEVFESGPNRFLIIILNGKEIMIPINGPFIKGVNKSKRKISVELPDGFLDI